MEQAFTALSPPFVPHGRAVLDTAPLGISRRGEDRSIDLPRGLPGFPGLRELTLKALPGRRTDLMLLAAPADGPRFVVLPLDEPDRFYGRGTISAAAGLLGMEPEDTGVFAIVTLRRGAEGLSAVPNLKAPLLIDMVEGRGEQMTLAAAAQPCGALSAGASA
jgi:flagellar assembly factor FliW